MTPTPPRPGTHPRPRGGRAIRGICDQCGGNMELYRYEWRCGECGNIVDRMTHFFRTQRPLAQQAVI